MHVVVPQNLPISVQGFFEDSSSLQAFYFSGTFQFFNVHNILKLTKSMPPCGEKTENLQPEIQQSNKLKAL